MRLGVNIFGGRTHHDPLIYRDLARQANGYGCGGGVVKPAPPYRPDLYPEYVDGTVCQPQSILSSKSPLPAGPYEVRADGKGEVWFQFDGVKPGWVKRKFDGSGEPQEVAFDGPLPAGKSFTAKVMTSDAGDPFRNLRCILPGGGEGTFRPEFLDDLAGFRVHRHLDTRSVNQAPIGPPKESPPETWAEMLANQPPNCSNDKSSKVPFEDLCELANLCGADIWLCIPYEANDEYVESMARLAHEKLDPGLTIYIEYCNELWNTAFKQGKAVETWQKANEPTTSRQIVIGRTAAAKLNRFKFSVPSSRRCVRVVCGQAAWVGDSKRAVLTAMDAGAVDAIGCAPYFGIFGSADVPVLAALGARWANGDATSLDELFGMLPPTIDMALGWTRSWKGLADQIGVPLHLYEFGQHLSRRDDPNLVSLYIAANRDPRMGGLYPGYLDGLRDAGADVACLYASHYPPQKYGVWGLREYVGQPDAEAPKAAAVRSWMARNPVVDPVPEPEPAPEPQPEPTPEPEPEPTPEPTPEPPTLTLLASINLMVDADGNVTFRARRPE